MSLRGTFPQNSGIKMSKQKNPKGNVSHGAFREKRHPNSKWVKNKRVKNG